MIVSHSSATVVFAITSAPTLLSSFSTRNRIGIPAAGDQTRAVINVSPAANGIGLANPADVPITVPAKEHWPRHNHENFYWLQEDLLRERQGMGRGWTYSIWRPQALFGNALGSPMNIIGALGVYAAMRREQGLPLNFPGGGELVTAATDTRLLAEAICWGGEAESAQNQTFNVINGDVLVWPHIWHCIADTFAMPLGGHEPEQLEETMPRQEAAWAAMTEKYDLRRNTLAEWIGSSWQFTDRSLATGIEHPAPSVLSPVKLNDAGFTKMIDTEASIVWWLKRLQQERWLPT